MGKIILEFIRFTSSNSNIFRMPASKFTLWSYIDEYKKVKQKHIPSKDRAPELSLSKQAASDEHLCFPMPKEG